MRTWRMAMAVLGLLVLAAAGVARGDLAPMPNADDAVFTATQVVVVSHVKEDVFAVEEAFVGSLKAKETVTLPGFKLVKWGEKMFGDPEAVAMDERTRVLLF